MSQNTSKESHVSIGMPVYNGESFLYKSIDSILSQTFENFELIISDNCSTDLTQDICLEERKKDKRIKFFRQNNRINAFSNFQYVLNEAKGKFFVWASIDDFWEEDFLKENVVKQILTLPLHSQMKNEFVERVIDGVSSFFSNTKEI